MSTTTSRFQTSNRAEPSFIVGALAEQGADLDTVTEAAKNVIKGGVHWDVARRAPCGLSKGGSYSRRWAELGSAFLRQGSSKWLPVRTMPWAWLLIGWPRKSAAVLMPLVNNLGGAPLEMAVLAEELAKSKIGPQIKWVIGLRHS